MFEQAARMKLRFNYKGQIGVEELWDLSLAQLDEVYRTLARQARDAQNDSLLVNSTGDTELALRIEIVKHIVSVKLQEQADKKDRAARRSQARQLDEIIAGKQNEVYAGMSLEELTAMRAALGA